MQLSLLTIIMLAIVQGAAELLPVSSSAHVIVVEKLLHLDPTTPPMTFLLVMLHTGTMLAVLVYFWPRWTRLVKGDGGLTVGSFVTAIVVATAATGVLGLILKKVIQHMIHGADVETIFGNLRLIAASLLAVGIFIIVSDLHDRSDRGAPLDGGRAVGIGLVQGLCLPFRGFSRSGATISLGLLQGLPRVLAEDFSFALAVVLTPPVIVIELHRMLKSAAVAGPLHLGPLLAPGVLGMMFSFGAGLLALKWLSAWLESGRWKIFGGYCLVASLTVWLLSTRL